MTAADASLPQAFDPGLLPEFLAYARGDPGLSAWEEGFLASLARSLMDHGARLLLSDRQLAVLAQVSAKLAALEQAGHAGASPDAEVGAEPEEPLSSAFVEPDGDAGEGRSYLADELVFGFMRKNARPARARSRKAVLLPLRTAGGSGKKSLQGSSGGGKHHRAAAQPVCGQDHADAEALLAISEA